MSEIYPILLVVMSFVLLLSLFFCFKPNKFTKKQNSQANRTNKIDALINNSNRGKRVIEYRNSLSQYDVKYVAWRANRNGSTK